MRIPCVIANWKMHGSLISISALLNEIGIGLSCLAGDPSKVQIVVCPPSVYMNAVGNILAEQVSLKSIQLGAQNVYCESKGAFTGEVSPEMLVDLGCRYVLIGHSERRGQFLENDDLVARKWVASYHAGLTPVFCVGETSLERQQGKTFETLRRQFESVVEKMGADCFAKGCLAYEPIWAIGTGLTATPEQAEEAHCFLRGCLAKRSQAAAEEIRILYGGSVTPTTVESILAQPNVDGVLVGGASLQACDFLTICKAVIARV